MSIWLDGRIVSNADAPLADDRGLLLGDGLFETVLVEKGAARLLPRHLARMRRSADALGLVVSPNLDALIDDALPQLHERESRPARGVLRITLTRGSGRGLAAPTSSPRLVLGYAEAPPRRGPARAHVVETPRIDPRSPLAGHKVIAAMDRVLARRFAQAMGADLALLPTIEGDIAEADAANLFLVFAGRIVVTPGLDRGVLPGITRARCLEALRRDGMPGVERRLARSDLDRAEEAFVCSSLDGVRPLAAIDGRAFPAPGPVTARLAACVDSCDA